MTLHCSDRVRLVRTALCLSLLTALSVRAPRALAADVPEMLNCGVPLARHLAAGATDTYRVPVSAGATVIVSIVDTSGSIGLLRLEAPGIDDTCRGEIQVAGSGEVIVEVSDCIGNDAGDYTISANVVGGPGNCGRPMPCGLAPSVRQLEVAGEVASYRFAGSTGDHVTLKAGDLTGAGGSVRLRLFDPDGLAVRGTDSCGGTVTATLEKTGNYTVLVSACRAPQAFLYTLGFAAPSCPAGPDVTYFGVARADSQPLAPSTYDSTGRPVYSVASGAGFFLVVEARPGTDSQGVAGEAFVYDAQDPTVLPDLQLLFSNPLGNGSKVVCDKGPTDPGGVPATVPLEFVTTQAVADAINDFGCRVNNGAGEPRGVTTQDACTQFKDGSFHFVEPTSTLQFCAPIAVPWAFPPGETIVAARARDTSGTVGAPREIVVRVASQGTPTTVTTPTRTPTSGSTATPTRTPTGTTSPAPSGVATMTPTPTRSAPAATPTAVVTPRRRAVTYVASSNRTVSIVDTAAGEILHTAFLDDSEPGFPSDIAVSPDGALAFVANFAGQVDVLETASNAFAGTIPLGDVTAVAHVLFAPDGSVAYVTSQRAVSVIETATQSVTATITLGRDAKDVAISPDGSRLYVTSDADIVVIDTATRSVTATIPSTSSSGFGTIAVVPDGNSAWAAGDGGIAVIDTHLNAVVATFSINGSLDALAFALDGTRAYALRNGSEIAVIDTISRTVQDIIPLDVPFISGGPAGRVALAPDGSTLSVLSPLNPCLVTLIDTATHAVTGTLPIVSPVGIAYATVLADSASPTPSPTRTPTPIRTPAPALPCAYLTQPHSDSVAVLDPTTNTVLGTIPVTQPLSVALSPDGTHVYVTSQADTAAYGRVAVIDTATSRVAQNVPVLAGQPMGVAVAPSGNAAYLSLRSSCYRLSVIDTASAQVTSFLQPSRADTVNYDIALAPDGRTGYMTSLTASSLLAVDAATKSLINSISFSDQPRHLAITPDGQLAYVPILNQSADEAPVVAVVSTATLEVIERIAVGNGPTYVAISPDGSSAYVANLQSDSVSIIDTATATVRATVPVGSAPDAVAFTPDGAAAYVANFASQDVSVIDTASAQVVATIPLTDGAQDVAIGLVPGGCVAPPATSTSCTGDCNDDGMVTVNEVIMAVNIALGNLPLGSCSAIDTNGDMTVTVDELVRAVTNALNGCPPH